MSCLVLFCSCVFRPFSIAITSLGEERSSLGAFCSFVRFALVWFCLFPLLLGVWEELRFVTVALPGLFSYLFFWRTFKVRVFYVTLNIHVHVFLIQYAEQVIEFIKCNLDISWTFSPLFCKVDEQRGDTCHRGGKSTWPDRDSNPGSLAYRASTLANWATEPHGRPATISPCLNRFVPESARNHAGTDETGPTLSHQMSQGRKKHMARPGLEPRTSRIPCEHSSQLSYRATRSTCDIQDNWLTPVFPPITLIISMQVKTETISFRQRLPRFPYSLRSNFMFSRRGYRCGLLIAYLWSHFYWLLTCGLTFRRLLTFVMWI